MTVMTSKRIAWHRLSSKNFCRPAPKAFGGCPTTRLLDSGNPTTRRKIGGNRGWVAHLAEQWTENLMFGRRNTLIPSRGCERERP